MVNAAIEEATARMQTLSPVQQQEVLDFIQSRQASSLQAKTPPGVPGRDLLHLAGLFSKEDAEEMMRVIEEDCERIDPDGW